MEKRSVESMAGLTPAGALHLPRALAPSGYPTSGPAMCAAVASSCSPSTRTRTITTTKPAAWQFADVRNHRTRRLWETSQ